MKILGIETDKGVFLSNKKHREDDWSKQYPSKLLHLYINGKLPEPTFSNLWVKIEGPLKTVERLVPGGVTNQRFEIKDKALISEDRPEIIQYNESDEYENIIGLYQYKFDEKEASFSPVEFEYEGILTIKNFKDYGEFSYPFYRDGDFGRDSKKNLVINQAGIIYQELDKIIFPEILLPNVPQKISSDAAYGIIRKHVKDHIDPKWARITSDYDFCFEVKKRIPLAKPYTRRREKFTPTGKRFKRPQFIEDKIELKEFSIFNMTPASRAYQSYQICPEFNGENQEDLQKNIDAYLSELMERINEPLKECEHCGGVGHIL